MLTVNDFDGVLIEYKRKGNRHPKGVVVATASGIVGWSLCDRKDPYDKLKGLSIALGRAEKAATIAVNGEDVNEFYATCPYSIEDLLVRMIDRSLKYFKVETIKNDND